MVEFQQELRQKPQRRMPTGCLLFLACSVCFLIYPMTALGNTTYSGLGPSMSIINQGNAPRQVCLQAVLMGHFFSRESLFVSRLCRIYKLDSLIDPLSPWHRNITVHIYPFLSCLSPICRVNITITKEARPASQLTEIHLPYIRGVYCHALPKTWYNFKRCTVLKRLSDTLKSNHFKIPNCGFL